jgi:hypothetical protein
VAQVNNPQHPQAILTERLLLSVIEQMKAPLLYIARESEAINEAAESARSIRNSAQVGLRLLDSYALGIRLTGDGTSFFDTEPVSVSGALYDAAHELEPYAQEYGVKLELQLDGRYGPVMAHREGLKAALVSLGSALVEALPAHETSNRLKLSAHRCRYGVVVGAYGDLPGLTTGAFRTGKQLHGEARQPFNTFLYGSGAGIFVADALLQAMRSHLSASRYRKQQGLGAVLQMNPQLRLM